MLNSLSYKTDQLLNQLDRVKQTGQGKWLARCPAHDDKSPSLAIKKSRTGFYFIVLLAVA